MGYSTRIGISGDILRMTVLPKLVALVKEDSCILERLRSTGSCISMFTDSSSLSAEVLCFQLDTTLANVAFTTEGDSFLINTNLACITQDTEITDNALEFTRGHFNVALVLSLRKTKVFTFNIHKLKPELGDAVLLIALKVKLKRSPPSSDFKVTISSFPLHFKSL